PKKIPYEPSKKLTPSLACFRAAITNGSRLLNDLDQRSTWARRLRDLIAAHVEDLGGATELSSTEMVLVRRCSMLLLQCELLEQQFADNDGVASPKSLETYQRCTNTLRRTAEALGLKRRPRDVTPTLGEILRGG